MGEQGAQWTHEQLAPVHCRFLDKLPLLVHASAHQPERWSYVDSSAIYALYDDSATTLSFYRVAYGHLGAIQALQRSGMPPAFAQRLERGL